MVNKGGTRAQGVKLSGFAAWALFKHVINSKHYRMHELIGTSRALVVIGRAGSINVSECS